MIVDATATIHARTTNQMIVERSRNAGLLFEFDKSKGDISDACGDATMLKDCSGVDRAGEYVRVCIVRRPASVKYHQSR